MGFGHGLPSMCGLSVALGTFRTKGEEEDKESKRQGKRKKSMGIRWYIRQSIGS